MLAVPSPDEQSILNAVSYRNNVVYLHRDPALMPRRKRVWSSWNVIQSDDPDADLCVTYWMNALQPIDHATPIFITLNPPRPPAEHLTFRTFNYAHPQFNQAAMDAQQRLDRIQGHNHSWFCGAWTGFGFHEDGLRSGFAVAQALGARLPWESTPQYAEAAE
jgi:predicted NAD/FAD-binding protein